MTPFLRVRYSFTKVKWNTVKRSQVWGSLANSLMKTPCFPCLPPFDPLVPYHIQTRYFWNGHPWNSAAFFFLARCPWVVVSGWYKPVWKVPRFLPSPPPPPPRCLWQAGTEQAESRNEVADLTMPQHRIYG